MDNKIKILLIVEGARLEPQFFDQIQKVYGLSFEIVCVKNNIYSLYKRMKEMDFQADIKQILLESTKDEKERARLKERFAYTYLIFDLDVQHTENGEKSKSTLENVNENLKRLQEMTEYFTDETDPTIGKIYINYPMMESFKDCNSFDDEEYLTSRVALNDLRKYKELVGLKKMSNKRLDSYLIDDFNRLSKLNLRKLQYILNGTCRPIEYAVFQELSKQSQISIAEKRIIDKDKEVAVLNTATFFALDYFGNKNGFFNNVMMGSDK